MPMAQFAAKPQARANLFSCNLVPWFGDLTSYGRNDYLRFIHVGRAPNTVANNLVIWSFTVGKLDHSGLELQKLAFVSSVILRKLCQKACSLMGEVGFVTQSSAQQPELDSYDDVIPRSSLSFNNPSWSTLERLC